MTDPATRSDMTFSTKQLRNGDMFELMCRLGGWTSQGEMVESAYDRKDGEDGFDSACRQIGAMHDCHVECQFLGKATARLRFSNFVDDGEAALFRLKYL
jgi:hypothetical protein